MKSSLGLLCALSLFLAALPSGATVTQPNGVVMPVDSANGEVQLYTLFQDTGEGIDYQADGSTTPATFSPLCDFKAKLVLNQTASVLAVGWYNVDPAATQPPADNEIYTIVPAGSPVGTEITSSDIKNDPNYKGGRIGFALTGWQTHYSEQKWNPVCTGCSPPGPWVTAVIYLSKLTPNAFYLAFEDGEVGPNPGDFNNDGDYNDYVYFLTGLTCSGGGEACNTDKPGVCEQGITQCAAGGLICQDLVAPSAEACDGLDNDCNGVSDEGDICPAGFVCDKGTCVKKCGSGEFTCSPDLVCDAAGFCVEPACEDVLCPTGQVCSGGTCKAPCDGIACPYPDVCRVGVCVDPCDGVTCESGQVCDGGVCKASCACSPCPMGDACEEASGVCKYPACVDVVCPAGTHCWLGVCMDSCATALCPSGQICVTGECVDDPSMGAGGGMNSSSSGFAVGVGGNDASGSGSGTSAGGGGAGSGAGGNGGGPGGRDEGGCGCDVPGGASSYGGAAGAALLAVLGLSRRRRRGAQLGADQAH
jgi:MYXO-CTERM domain-containing protein